MQVHLVLVGEVGVAVLGLLVDLFLRVVGAEVALRAGLRLARLGLREAWRVWQALHEPSEPSGLMRPMPELGQLRRDSLFGLDLGRSRPCRRGSSRSR